MKYLQPKYTGSFFLVVFLALWFNGIYQWLSMPLIGAFFLLMIAILESTQERILKGTSLILFGIGFGIFLPKALIPSKEFAQNLPPDLISNLEIFKNLVVFSCSGAGGSIIAGHAERFLPEVERVDPQVTTKNIDHSKDIRDIQYELSKIKRYLIYFSGVVVTLLMLLLAIAI